MGQSPGNRQIAAHAKAKPGVECAEPDVHAPAFPRVPSAVPERATVIQSGHTIPQPRIIATFKALGKQKINAWRVESPGAWEGLQQLPVRCPRQASSQDDS
jgi:hypothetical protein